MKDKVLDDKVREEIIAAATGVFETYGFIKVSMQDISSASRKGRSSLYYYFNNKTEVFDAVVEKMLKHTLELCAHSVSKDASLAQNMANFQLQKLKAIKVLVKQYYLVFRDLRHDPSLLFNKMRLLLDEEFALIDQVLRWAIEKGEIKPLSPQDSRFLGETMVVALRSFEQEIILFDRFPDFEEKLTWIVEIFCNGLK
ncbi:TetR/AcrR family transcriptional regulator [Mucilaginibacter paludis]|uniref:Regulatory protein TetR n=1 Tax=Mucilaginibacter paludis DSM 18603 TaxID=714943 RepID=H1Y361_9SPHI|nr:TetR/AcrR family transcriptional regulator [Mucilaginibacter paludis]EHQ28879.1 regulatory protein TetR [Mucilaginibacter paludis DSM 18603]